MSGRVPKRVYPLAALLVLLGIGGLCAFVALSLNRYRVLALFPISFVLLTAGQIYNHYKRRHDWFSQTFRTYENFRAEVIEEARQVRHEKGNAGVVRHLKILYPHLPTTMMTRLMKEL
ncbi:hypothetical protein [Streptomyces sp. Isolate_219]|uniref:hypothetical protein n=1 Tax=Streptomyces sp. Isolate_219 TaxID=2950110 RepID=UPI0021C5B7D8|nr:hypothetical protein [Streptomyces sp. Isolate_219]MCR8574866.1 hypothetical protein [Streptomyces sp. Isolate_219]